MDDLKSKFYQTKAGHILLTDEQIKDVIFVLCDPNKRNQTWHGNGLSGPLIEESNTNKIIGKVFESCGFKTVMSGVLGMINTNN